MGVEIRKPKNLGVRNIFMFWLKNLEREKPYLLVKHRASRSTKPGNCTEVWYTIKHELEYLRNKILDLEAEILDLERRDTDKTRFTSLTIRTFELKKEVYHIKDKIKQLTKLSPEDKKLLMTYDLFSKIITSFNKKAIEAIVQGEVLNLGNRLGFLKIKKINRYSPSVDWGASKARRQELVNQGILPRSKDYPQGENWFIYRQSDFYLRWAWTKRFRESGIPMLKNCKLYAFYPSNNSSGNDTLGAKGLLSKANQENKLLHLRYETVKI